MSLFPKFKIPTDTPATLATPATFRPESSKNSGSSNRQATQKADFPVSGEDDPILPLEAWYPVFKELHHRVLSETPNFDYLWLKEQRLELYQGIKAKENGLDSLKEARLSEVMSILGQWRELVLKAEFEQRRANKGKAEVIG